jgi:aspartyl protease family protein
MKSNFKTVGVLAIWLTLAGALFYFFNTKLHPNTAEKLSNGSEVRLERDISGHYRAEAFINGMKTTVLVDTGATDVSISQKLANRLGIQSNAAIRTQTANGEAVVYMTRLASVKLGGIEATNVAAIIAPDLGEDMLLGMSFLNRMDVRLYKGTMTIRAITDQTD